MRDKEGTYGKGAVKELARALGWSQSTVYAYAAVAAWPEMECGAIVAERDCFGKPLSWWHLVTLAGVSNPEQRQQLLNKTLEAGWTIRKLKDSLRASVGSDKDADLQAAGALASIAKKYATKVAAFKRNCLTLGKRLTENIQEADPDDVPNEFLDHLQEARKNIVEGGQKA